MALKPAAADHERQAAAIDILVSPVTACLRRLVCLVCFGCRWSRAHRLFPKLESRRQVPSRSARFLQTGRVFGADGRSCRARSIASIRYSVYDQLRDKRTRTLSLDGGPLSEAPPADTAMPCCAKKNMGVLPMRSLRWVALFAGC